MVAIPSASATLRADLNAAPAQPNRTASGDGISSVAVLTSVLWLGCFLVGALGFALPYARPHPATPPAPTLRAELIKVELTSQLASAPASIIQLPPSPPQPPPLSALITPPLTPQFVAVAQPIPAIAFVLPVEAPVRIVESKQAAFVRPAPQPATVAPGTGTGQPSVGPAPAPAPPVQTLTYGEGEGRQPAPRYPDSSRRAGQEGTVVVRFSVDADGRVLAAEPSAPSPWGALNREALRVVREQWQFKPGPVRLYEVAIRFELKK